MFLAVYISGSYQFCGDGKGTLYTLHVEHLKTSWIFPYALYQQIGTFR